MSASAIQDQYHLPVAGIQLHCLVTKHMGMNNLP